MVEEADADIWWWVVAINFNVSSRQKFKFYGLSVAFTDLLVANPCLSITISAVSCDYKSAHLFRHKSFATKTTFPIIAEVEVDQEELSDQELSTSADFESVQTTVQTLLRDERDYGGKCLADNEAGIRKIINEFEEASSKIVAEHGVVNSAQVAKESPTGRSLLTGTSEKQETKTDNVDVCEKRPSVADRVKNIETQFRSTFKRAKKGGHEKCNVKKIVVKEQFDAVAQAPAKPSHICKTESEDLKELKALVKSPSTLFSCSTERLDRIEHNFEKVSL